MNSQWLLLIISVPGKSATPRMRIWRALKASGAGIMRDGVYVLPQTQQHRNLLEQQAAAVRKLQGTAFLIEHQARDQTAFAQIQNLFDRSDEYAAWQAQALAFKQRLPALSEARARREQAQHRRELEALASIDFFPDGQRSRAQQLLADIEHELNRIFSPDEPSSVDGTIAQYGVADFTGRCWATRANLWIDRVASAWLIKRFIDHAATFVWLQDIGNIPAGCVSFDFDGAAFTHVDRYVTFEVLTRSFQMQTDSALRRVGELVHYLDVGGAPVAEAAGLLALLTGARERSATDDEFLRLVSVLLDHLYAAFQQQVER